MYVKLLILLAFFNIVSMSLVCMVKNLLTIRILIISTICFVGWVLLGNVL